ncbi:MAG: A24 family peptidase [Pseudomonadota bacterium]
MPTAFTDPVFLTLTAALMAALTALAWIDARTYRLPDVITLPLILAGLVAAWLLQRDLLVHALGAALGYAGLVAIEKAYERWRGRPGLGRGDAKLMAAAGAWCGAWALPLILLSASAAGLVFVLALKLSGRAVRSETAVAFGPFLALAIALVWFLMAAGVWPPDAGSD